MKVINYKVEDDRSKTKCPYMMKIGEDISINVGGTACYECEHCIANDERKCVVVCKCDELLYPEKGSPENSLGEKGFFNEFVSAFSEYERISREKWKAEGTREERERIKRLIDEI